MGFFTFVFLQNERLVQDKANFFDNASTPREYERRESSSDPTDPQYPVRRTHTFVKSKDSFSKNTDIKSDYQSLTQRQYYKGSHK